MKTIPVAVGGDHLFRTVSALLSSDEQGPAPAELQDCKPLPWQWLFVLLVITFSYATLCSGTDQLWATESKESHPW